MKSSTTLEEYLRERSDRSMSNYTISSELRGDDQAEDKDKQVILRLNPQHVTGETLVFSVEGNTLSEFNEEEADQKDEEARSKRAAKDAKTHKKSDGDADPNPVTRASGKKH